MEDVEVRVDQVELPAEVQAQQTEDAQHRRSRCPAPKSTVDPAGASKAASSAGERNLAIGERTSPSSSTTTYASPFAPHSFARSSRRWISLRENALGATMKRTDSAFLKTPNSDSRVTAVASWISRPKRRSGLSEP